MATLQPAATALTFPPRPLWQRAFNAVARARIVVLAFTLFIGVVAALRTVIAIVADPAKYRRGRKPRNLAAGTLNAYSRAAQRFAHPHAKTPRRLVPSRRRRSQRKLASTTRSSASTAPCASTA